MKDDACASVCFILPYKMANSCNYFKIFRVHMHELVTCLSETTGKQA